jgi:purine nucleoside phosphorylase
MPLHRHGSSARQAVTMASHADPLHVAEIVGYIRSTLAPHPELADLDVGIVCGSGLSGLSAAIEAPVAIPYSSIPHFPRSTVAGHGTELVFGRLGGKKVVAARGRFHFYEGHGTATLGILPRVFAALGAKVVVVTNAAGGVNPSECGRPHLPPPPARALYWHAGTCDRGLRGRVL